MVFTLIPGTGSTGGCFSSICISRAVPNLQILGANVANAQVKAYREGAIFGEAQYKLRYTKPPSGTKSNILLYSPYAHCAQQSVPIALSSGRPIERRLRWHHAGLQGEFCDYFREPTLVHVVFE